MMKLVITSSTQTKLEHLSLCLKRDIFNYHLRPFTLWWDEDIGGSMDFGSGSSTLPENETCMHACQDEVVYTLQSLPPPCPIKPYPMLRHSPWDFGLELVWIERPWSLLASPETSAMVCCSVTQIVPQNYLWIGESLGRVILPAENEVFIGHP